MVRIGVAAVAAALVLTGCAASSTGTVPYRWTPPETPPQSSGFAQAVQVDASLADAQEAYLPGDKVTVRLRWVNQSDRDQSGSSRVQVRTPVGLKVLDSPGCWHALVNDLACDFEGELAPRGAASRTLVFSMLDDFPPAGADIVFRTASGGSATVRVASASR